MKEIKLTNNEIIYQFRLPLNGANMYVLISEKRALLIDCFRDEYLLKLFVKYGIEEVTVVLTHEHWDHASGVEWLREQFPSCKVLCGENAKENLEDSRKNMSSQYKALITLRDRTRKSEVEKANIHPYEFSPDVLFSNREIYTWENHMFQFYFTPGHTSGSVCILLDEKYIFTGDSLVNGNKPVTRFPTGSQKQYDAITGPFLGSLPGEMKVFPGHGETDELKNIIKYIL